MQYRVELSRRAQCDSEEAFLYIRERAPLNAVRWRHGLYTIRGSSVFVLTVRHGARQFMRGGEVESIT